jgi:hypothetical protein
VFGNKIVEDFQVAGFLVVHVFHQWSEVWVRSDDLRRLCFVDQGRSEFAGLVDAERTVQVLALLLAEDISWFRRPGRSASGSWSALGLDGGRSEEIKID